MSIKSLLESATLGGKGLLKSLGPVLDIIQQEIDAAGGGGFPSIALIQDQKTAAAGGTFTSGAPRTRDLNTIVRNDIGLTLDTNRFTLLAGSYYIRAVCPAMRVGTNQAWLVEDPAGSPTIVIHGTSFVNINDTTDGSDGPGLSAIEDVLIVGASTEYEIQHQCDTTKTSNGFGNIGAFQNSPSIFTNLLITQIA